MEIVSLSNATYRFQVFAYLRVNIYCVVFLFLFLLSVWSSTDKVLTIQNWSQPIRWFPGQIFPGL